MACTDAERMRKYRQANLSKVRERERWSKIWIKYKVTKEQWALQYDLQKGRCLGCDKLFGTKRVDLPCVDHDHETGKFRGLLCHECNRALGLLKDSVFTLLRLIDYIK